MNLIDLVVVWKLKKGRRRKKALLGRNISKFQPPAELSPIGQEPSRFARRAGSRQWKEHVKIHNRGRRKGYGCDTIYYGRQYNTEFSSNSTALSIFPDGVAIFDIIFHVRNQDCLVVSRLSD